MPKPLSNFVYKITLHGRVKNNAPPYYYIGSKCNAYFKNGNIYNSKNKIYIGSPSIKDWKDICVDYSVEILYESHIPHDLLNIERTYQRLYDVVNSNEYFNRSYAVDAYFNMPCFGMYKDFDGNVLKLHRNDYRVATGLYVGINSGLVHTQDHKNKISKSMLGNNNHFFGKSHTQETKDKIRKSKLGTKASDETKYKMSKKRKGISKSDEHKKKIGRKGLVVLKNIHTAECIRIPKEDMVKYDLSIWISPYAYKCKFFPESTKGKCNLVNKYTGEKMRINTVDKSKYDLSIWISPQAYAKLKKVLI